MKNVDLSLLCLHDNVVLPTEVLKLHEFRNDREVINMHEWYIDHLEDDTFIIVQDYLGEQTTDLMDYILEQTETGESLPAAEVQEIFYKSYMALKVIHDKGSLHNDVKGKRKQ